jgi:hypothetical protein
MTPRDSIRLATALAGVAVTAAGCSNRDTGGLEEAPVSTDPVVFTDDFNGVHFEFFGDGATFNDNTITVDSSTPPYRGSASVKLVIPDHPMWTGAAFPSDFYRDLSGYTALTFWASASESTTFDVVGLGNDNSGESEFTAEWRDLTITPGWDKYIVPIPLPEKLMLERGMFFFADAVPQGNAGVTVWLDDIVFENVSGITNPRPSMATQQLDTFAGTTWRITEIQTTFSVDGVDQVIGHMPGYFEFSSSDEAVATVDNGVITVVGGGTAEISATFDGMDVDGTVTISSALPDPTSAAPTPIHPESGVISVFSNAYTNVFVDRWSADWDYANVSDLQIAGDDVKLYELVPGPWQGAAIEYTTETIDASAMTHIHVDVWSTDDTGIALKLVDFGANGVFGGGDDSEHEMPISIVTGEWVGIELMLADFTNLASREHLAQLVVLWSPGTLYVDNIYFHD